MASCLKSLSRFKFVFVYGVRVYSNVIDLHAAFQLYQQHLLKRFFSHCIYLPPLSQTDCRYVGLLLGSTVFH